MTSNLGLDFIKSNTCGVNEAILSEYIDVLYSPEISVVLFAGVLNEVVCIVSHQDSGERRLIGERAALEKTAIDVTKEFICLRKLPFLRGIPVSVESCPASIDVDCFQIARILLRDGRDRVLHTSINVGTTACVGLIPSAFKVFDFEISEMLGISTCKAFNTKEGQNLSNITLK